MFQKSVLPQGEVPGKRQHLGTRLTLIVIEPNASMNPDFERFSLIHTLLTPSLLFMEIYIQHTKIIKTSVGRPPSTKNFQGTSHMILKN